jgi:hypothetical protein
LRFTQKEAVDTVVCAPDDGWKYHPKHVEQFTDINNLCNVASCWIYEYIGILLGAHPILHISGLKVNEISVFSTDFRKISRDKFHKKKIRPVRAESFHADRLTDRQT